jgi:hypothetical protein
VTLITLQEGKLVLRDGKVGTEQACCCGECVPCPGQVYVQIEEQVFAVTSKNSQNPDIFSLCYEYDNIFPPEDNIVFWFSERFIRAYYECLSAELLRIHVTVGWDSQDVFFGCSGSCAVIYQYELNPCDGTVQNLDDAELVSEQSIGTCGECFEDGTNDPCPDYCHTECQELATPTYVGLNPLP